MLSNISKVIIYKGHTKHPLLGPYAENVVKRIKMFHCLNDYRLALKKSPWHVVTTSGERLKSTLEKENPEKVLLVIPAGQSSHLDKVFSKEQTEFLWNFFHKGGRGYFNCGSAYWVSEKRIYTDLCSEQPNDPKTLEKRTQLPLFKGVSVGPLCPYPGKQYRVGFFSDAVTVTNGKSDCTIFLSGGGSFFPRNSDQKVKVLARYKLDELERLKKNEFSIASLMISIGKGAALLSMFHPYYGSKDIDAELYEKTFPNSGTNWKSVHKRLSSLDVRMNFALDMITQLETLDF